MLYNITKSAYTIHLRMLNDQFFQPVDHFLPDGTGILKDDSARINQAQLV